MSSLDADHLTREEKAARIRAEIARRREQLLQSEPETRYFQALEESKIGNYSDPEYYDHPAGTHDNFLLPEDDYLDYEEDLYYDPRAYPLLDPRIAHLQPGGYLSRSLDAGFDEYEQTYDGYFYPQQHQQHLMYRGELS